MIAGGVVLGTAIIGPYVVNKFAAHLPGLLSPALDSSGKQITVGRVDKDGNPVGSPQIMDNVYIPNAYASVAYSAGIPILAGFAVKKFAPHLGTLSNGLMIGGIAAGIIFALSKVSPSLIAPSIAQQSFVTDKELTEAYTALLPAGQTGFQPNQALPPVVIQGSAEYIRGTSAWQNSESPFANTGF